MNLSTAIRGLFSRDVGHEKSWPSVVMLLRRPRHLSAEGLSTLADAAWGKDEPEGRVSPTIIHTSKATVVLRLAPRIVVSIHQDDHSYSSRRATDAAQSDSSLVRMWAEHTAWCAVDIPDRYELPVAERKDCYKLLLRLVNKMWGTDVCGLYLPAEDAQIPLAMPSQIPNMGNLIASLTWSVSNHSQKKAKA